MEDSQFPGPSNGPADEENRRHNNLRRDILTSLLEVDQSIKGLEHHLLGRIQQIEDRLHPPETASSPDEPARRCEFAPAATTAWALKILQDNLSPLTSGISALQSALRSLQGKEGAEGLLAGLMGEITPLREMVPLLKEEMERVRGSVSGLQESSPAVREQGAATLGALDSINRTLSTLRGSLEGLQERMVRSQEAMAPLGEDLSRLKQSVLDLTDGLTPLRETVEGAA